MRKPSAHARLRMRMVVTERCLMRARMLQMMKMLPGTPRRKTRPRMRAPRAVEKSLLTTLGSSRVALLVVVMLKKDFNSKGERQVREMAELSV